MRLSHEHRQQLFEFTEKKFVRYYDLQLELVECLTSSIEGKMQTNPNVSFETALEETYKGFGIFGFAKVVQEKESALVHERNKMLWQETKGMFSWPKIMLVALCFMVCWECTRWFSIPTLKMLFWGLWLVGAAATVAFLYLDKKSERRRLLSTQHYPGFFNGSVIYCEYLLLSSHISDYPLTFSLIVTAGVLIKLASLRVYSDVKKLSKVQYPEAFSPA